MIRRLASPSWAAVYAAVLVACSGCTRPGTDTDHGKDSDTSVSRASSPTDSDSDSDSDGVDTVPAAEWIACPEGVLQCPLTQGCHDGICGGCEDAVECHDLEGCRPDDTCGDCLDASDCREGEACRVGFCLPVEPPVWSLEIAPKDWATMEAYYYDEIFVPCALTAGGTLYDEGVQCRLYGGTTRSYPKRSFRVEFPEDADHPGYSRNITLRAEYNDPSFLRTFLGYETFRQLTPLPTPRTRYIELHLNGENYGLMVEAEQIRGRFLELRGRDRDQPMYEPVHSDEHGALTPNDDIEEYLYLFDNQTGDEDDVGPLLHLIEDTLMADHLAGLAAGQPVLDATRATVHVDAYRQYLAIMAVLQNHDHVTNNFLFSWQEAGYDQAKWEFYPIDFDLTFGCLWDAENQDTICDDFQWEGWWLNGTIPEGIEVGVDPVWGNLLIDLVLDDPQNLVQYEQEICDVLVSPWWSGRAADLIVALRETIADSAARDPNDLSGGPNGFQTGADEVESFIGLRQAYLHEALACDAP